MEDHFRKAEIVAIIERPGMEIRLKALVSFLYLTGARVSEVVKVVRKYQIELNNINGVPFLIVNDVPIEKRRIKMSRNIPINIQREKPFVDVLLKYISLLNNEDILFDIKRSRAFQLVQKATGKGPHFLRHSRLTALAVDYGFDSFDLQRFTGWASNKTAESYIHKNFSDIANKMT